MEKLSQKLLQKTKEREEMEKSIEEINRKLIKNLRILDEKQFMFSKNTQEIDSNIGFIKNENESFDESILKAIPSQTKLIHNLQRKQSVLSEQNMYSKSFSENYDKVSSKKNPVKLQREMDEVITKGIPSLEQDLEALKEKNQAALFKINELNSFQKNQEEFYKKEFETNMKIVENLEKQTEEVNKNIFNLEDLLDQLTQKKNKVETNEKQTINFKAIQQKENNLRLLSMENQSLEEEHNSLAKQYKEKLSEQHHLKKQQRKVAQTHQLHILDLQSKLLESNNILQKQQEQLDLLLKEKSNLESYALQPSLILIGSLVSIPILAKIFKLANFSIYFK
ncbi:hypothetical protein M0811_03712 [Anaeramoeba ignava]|uniref:Uncharacterized protein n=1 Tax=Anaeramoeba ignava TaxID=1746090 RepID=A0A9Q0LZF9_ANAIG|nr:hypothetical protein M0811_03712 [Anaeramoeba ignava]